MKRTFYISSFIIIAVAALATCRKPFMPDVADTNLNVLVVEGVINNGLDSTIIKLTRSMELDYRLPSYSLTTYIPDKTTIKPELNATVTVEDEQGAIYTLTGLGKGKYGAPAAVLNASKKYHLKIVTSAGVVYTSNAEEVKDAPPIDTLSYRIGSGLSFYANTHDGTNKTKYYRWEYEEAWRFRMPIRSMFVTDGRQIIPRPYSVEFCFGHNNSVNIMLASTVKQTNDIILEQPITTVASNEEKLTIRYSILVKQYALSQAAYEFWDNMRRNTENLGGIFDQQPSAPVSNIRCVTDPALPALGFVSVGAVRTKRIYINKIQLPSSWQYRNPNTCGTSARYIYDLRTKTNSVEQDLVPYGSFDVPVDTLSDGLKVIGYSATSIFCADCTTKGVVTRPYFWRD
ncbi:DUF4249 domain-containing protein [Mucilaginibacter myungsuensis]|uniref:DUF4249 domain-containing protein n=1 Tax=Mucilaginibacter myungsuensis TaxID=649104 RepID=A0A929KZJ9_9SPHI|nr:DUF4249 domain-containing protein [Mucilaginibacter myungsuensis]MBE9664092.1 DUF4249 domain-containing protein [Mucilaginibacter myungsuensis]MDN3601271.1 DUF4249 domain-containing protein [Mucilaginibacter myungsuensis]